MTSQAEFKNENVPYDHPLVPMRIFRYKRNRDLAIDWHFHKEIEFLAVLRGRMDVYIEDEFYPLHEGDVLLIGASQLHRDRSYAGTGLRYIVFQLDMQQFFDPSTVNYLKYFAEMSGPLSRLNYIFRDNDSAKQVIFQTIMELYEEARAKKEGYEIAVSMLVRKIILTLLRSDTRKVLQLNANADMLRLKPALDYIDKNLTGKIQVEEASKAVGISYYYFVKLFKKTVGMSFIDYINYQKIKRAEQILLTKDYNIIDVGEAIGMPNMAHFYKVFRKFNGCSPNQFRKKMLEWEKTDLEPLP